MIFMKIESTKRSSGAQRLCSVEELTSQDRIVKMKNKVTFNGALSFTKWSVRFVCTWPPSRSATKREHIIEGIAWWFSFSSVFFLFIPLVHSIYECHMSSFVLTQSLCFCTACSTIIAKTLVLRIYRTKLQVLVDEMMEFIKDPKPHERRILQSYMDRCWIFHVVITFMNYLATTFIIFGPFFFPEQRMPTAAIYPFSIDSGILMYLVFIHQSFVGLQSSAALTVDCQMAMMMWYASVRLEILAEEIRVGFNVKNVASFVEKHQHLLSYASEVAETMRYISFTTVCACGIASIMCCMQFVGNQAITVKMQFLPVTIGCLISLLVCAWPTENMFRVCDLIGTSVYNTLWFEMSPKLKKDIIIILQTAQRPVQVSISGFLPALSFHFYGSFLSGVFSYFTTLRVLIMSDDDK